MKQFLVTVLALTLGVAGAAPAETSLGVRTGLKAVRGTENITAGFVIERPKPVAYDSVDHGSPAP